MQVFQMGGKNEWVVFPGPELDWGCFLETVRGFMAALKRPHPVSPVWLVLTAEEEERLGLMLSAEGNMPSRHQIEMWLSQQVCGVLNKKYGMRTNTSQISRKFPSPREGDEFCLAIKFGP